MKYIISKSLILFCIFTSVNLAAQKKAVTQKGIEARVSQAIKNEFLEREVIFEIPKEMQDEFEVKERAIINNLIEKMTSMKMDDMSSYEISDLVKQAFASFIDRVKYCQISQWVHIVLANIKKDRSARGSSSSIKVDPSLKKIVDNPPYLPKKTENILAS